MSTSEGQVFARALYDALMSAALGSLRTAAAKLETTAGSAAGLEQKVLAAVPPDAPREVRNFLLVLAREGALDRLPAIIQSFEQYSQRQAQPLAGEVTSAVALDDTQRAKILNDLRAKYTDQLDLRFLVDPTLIGGLIIRIGDQVLDNSLRARLSAVQRNMLAS